MMGSRGPVPKRESQRRHRIKTGPVDKVEASGSVPVPPAEDEWHPIAKRWYEALGDSAQSKFYEPSDWASAYLIAESMSRDLSPQWVAVTEKGESVYERIPLKGASLSAYLKAMSVLLVTEGDRRRMKMEIQRVQGDPDEEAAVTAIHEYSRRRSSS